MTINVKLFALTLGGSLVMSAGGCGDTHKIPAGAPKENTEPVTIDMGGGTEASESAPPAGETPATETPSVTEGPSDGAAPAAEKSPPPTEEK